MTHTGQNIDEITVADPTRKLDLFRLKITTQLESVDGRWEVSLDENNETTSVRIELPAGEYAGQSVTGFFE